MTNLCYTLRQAKFVQIGAKIMKIPFVKMHGAGNDYVYVDATKIDIEFAVYGV